MPKSGLMQQHIAVKALMVGPDGGVLLLRKSQDDVRHAGNSGRYNLPGGKVQPGEALLSALRREVLEETGLYMPETALLQPMFVGEWRPVVQGVQLHIVGLFYVIAEWEGQVVLNSEHDEYLWVQRQDLQKLVILPPEDQALLKHFVRL